MINLLTIILLIFIYIIDTLFILSFYQQDNYHLRIIINQIKKHFLTEIYKLIFFIYLLINKIAILPLLIIYILLIYKKIKKIKFKKTKRIIRLFIIEILIITIILIHSFNSLTLIILNNIYLLLNSLIMITSNNIEKIINRKYYKQAYQKIQKYKPLIIGITGSCGKTSVKNYIYECLKDDYLVYKSEKSYNTLTGLSITVNKYLKHYNQILILEMGLSHKGDITKITKYFKPDISIITEILPSHLETMKSIGNIINEKMQIIKNMKENGLIIINNDNQYIKENINKYNINNNKIIKIGLNNNNDYYSTNVKIKENGLELNIIDILQNKNYYISNNLIGRHNVYNLLITYAIIKEFNISITKLNNLHNYENRLQLIKINNLTILNDSYNSNIKGFLNALEVLSLYKKQKIIITPGIVEIGKETKNTIKQICNKIKETCDFCYLINNKNTKIFIENFTLINYPNFMIKNTFKEAYNEVKNKDIILLIENDLTDYYLLK